MPFSSDFVAEFSQMPFLQTLPSCILALLVSTAAIAHPQYLKTEAATSRNFLTPNKPKIIDASRFHGRAAEAYRAAQFCPQILRQLFPYAAPDEDCLLQEFTTMHGATNSVSQEEAILARALDKQHLPIEQIQRIIDQKFQSTYPFTHSTPALEAYRARRIWKPDAVLDPNRLFGHAAEAYRAAQSCPQVLKQLFPYSGKDVLLNDTSLLDEFTTNSGIDDRTSQDEAILASKLYKENVPLDQIQKTIDQTFERCYPFTEPSPALVAYRSHRLWKPEADAAQKLR